MGKRGKTDGRKSEEILFKVCSVPVFCARAVPVRLHKKESSKAAAIQIAVFLLLCCMISRFPDFLFYMGIYAYFLFYIPLIFIKLYAGIAKLTLFVAYTLYFRCSVLFTSAAS